MTSKQQVLRIAATSLIAMSTFTGLANAANGNASTATVVSSQTEAREPSFFARLFGTARNADEQRVSYDTYNGSANYVCSPSGFGKRSACSLRGN